MGTVFPFLDHPFDPHHNELRGAISFFPAILTLERLLGTALLQHLRHGPVIAQQRHVQRGQPVTVDTVHVYVGRLQDGSCLLQVTVLDRREQGCGWKWEN